MKEQYMRYIARMARSARLDRLIQWSGQARIFPFYHAVSEHPIPHVSHIYRVPTPVEFEKDLEELLRWFEPMDMDTYLQQAGTGKSKRGMVLTFDDGLKECHRIIAPLLKKKGIPAVFFLNNRYIDNHGLFYRYKASLIIHKVRDDCHAMEKVSEFLRIPQIHVEKSIRMIGPHQGSLLESLAGEVGVEYSSYLRNHPVYMETKEVKELLKWGFHIGGHSMEHQNFVSLEAAEMFEQVRLSIEDLMRRFRIDTRFFSFPFTSDGIPRKVIDGLLNEGIATVLMGTAGLKKTGRPDYIQRIPMENKRASAMETLQTEYLYYLLKAPLGKNRLRY